MIGKSQVVIYEGVIPQGGKSVIEFAGHKLVHRSIKKDKSDLLVHAGTGVIIRSYPIGSDRSIILDDMAENIYKLDHFLDNPTSYELVKRCDMSKIEIKKPPNALDLLPAPHNISYRDVAKIFVSKIKRTFNVGKAVW